MRKFPLTIALSLLATLTACKAVASEPHCHPGDPACGSLLPLLVTLSGTSLSRSPAAIDSLKLWLEADSLALSDGSAVATWPDSSTQGFDAQQASGTEQPIFIENAFGSQPGVRFDGNATLGDHFTLGSNYLFATGDGLTIVAVVRSDLEDDNADFVYDFGRFANTGYGLAYSSNADGVNENFSAYASSDFGGPTVMGTRAIQPSQAAIILSRIRFAGAADQNSQIHINGTLIVEDTNFTITQLSTGEITEDATRAANSGPITIGGQSKTGFENDRFFGGDMGAVLFYDRVLSDAELGGLQCYLSEKYSVALEHEC